MIYIKYLYKNFILDLIFQRRLNVYITSSDRRHLPFNRDSDLKEHAEQCIDFDESILNLI